MARGISAPTASAFAVLFAAVGQAAAVEPVPGLPVGAYVLDPSHASIVFTVNHLGMSAYTASFDRFTAELDIDPYDPGNAKLVARVEAASLDLPSPPDGFLETMLGPPWFDAATYPDITFVSSDVILDAENKRARVVGQLTFLGATREVPMDVTFNGGWPPNPFDAGGRIGFSAEMTLSRSEFGMREGLPLPGTRIGVGDTVALRIEAEFVGATED